MSKTFIFDSKNFILALEWQEICNYSLTSRNKQTATTMTTKLLSEELVKTPINVKHCMSDVAFNNHQNNVNCKRTQGQKMICS